jgi:hypothetical protein
MKLPILATLFFLAAASVCFSQEHAERPHREVPSVSSPSRPAGWIHYISAEGRYSISFPDQPKLSTQETKTADGVKFLQYLASASNETETCLVAYFDRVPGTTFSLDKARDGFISAIKGRLITENEIGLNGQPGRELRVEATGQDGITYVLRVKIFDMGARIYVLQFITRTTEADNASVKRNASEYFDSFIVKD